jgi:nucleoside-diphosphate-sugar epimerase
MVRPFENVVVTGGSGFIGTHLLLTLLSEPSVKRITVMDLCRPQIEDPRVDYVRADLREPLDYHLKVAADVCFHLAALCKEPKFGWEDYFLTNHIGTRHLCEFAARENISNIVFTSTMMVYRAGERRSRECDCTAPDTAYGISKLLAEATLEKWAMIGGRTLHIVRPGVVFGLGERGNFTRLYEALKKGRFAYVGRSSTRKACIYVKDLCCFMRLLADLPNVLGTYNAALPETATIKEICETFCKVFELRNRIPTVPYRLALIAGYCGEVLQGLGVCTALHHRRIEKLFYSTDIATDAMLDTGFRPSYTLAEGLTEWRDQCFPGALR